MAVYTKKRRLAKFEMCLCCNNRQISPIFAHNIRHVMHIKDVLHFDEINLQSIHAPMLQENNITLNVLRFDKLHEVVSGNKWFKLQFYVEEAIANNATTIATFGGAYSNHIVATAFTCKVLGVKCVGVIRGEEPQQLSHTLRDAQSYGMQFIFKSRADYRNKEAIKNEHPEYYWVDEGGFGKKGSAGARQMLSFSPNVDQYTHIVGAVGSGTMLAGIADAAFSHQHIIGINVMKGNEPLINQVWELMTETDRMLEMKNEYHFGGYAKYTPELINFMNNCWHIHQLPLDFVYSAKSFYATLHLIETKQIPEGSKVLYIHCGGLQGNLSLPEGTLAF